MVGYSCHRCPLAFEVGWFLRGDLSCAVVYYICRHCGTMHKTEHRDQQPDLLHALNGPILEMEKQSFTTFDDETVLHPNLPLEETSWQFVGPLPLIIQPDDEPCALVNRARAVAFDRLSCGHCGKVGGFLSEEWPLDVNGKWPAFGEHCPVCNGELVSEYVTT
jgi:hypothetical protein